jgi:threonine dehydrogenase-like Zn-dependent dehydrogenase
MSSPSEMAGMAGMAATATMRALALIGPRQMEVREIARPAPEPREVLLKVGAVGLCGTDFHIFEGHANYHCDTQGRPVPLSEQAQIMGHEFCGTVVEVGSAVSHLNVGDRVVVDQGLSCVSRAYNELCEYCITGNSHQCAEYGEYGITGLQGALAEYIAVPGVNAVKVESDLPLEQCALVEPLGCVIHSSAMLLESKARYTFGGERPVRNVLVCGAGPAGLLFTQYLRNVLGFDGLLLVSEPSSQRRELVMGYGASAALDPTHTHLVPAVQDLTHGERIHCLIESAGVAQLFGQMPGLLRKQATVLLYGHGHHGADLGVLNNLQFLEPTLVSPIGASGGFEADGRPTTYLQALHLLSNGRINLSKFITHCYRTLEDVRRGFEQDRRGTDFIKGVALFDH